MDVCGIGPSLNRLAAPPHRGHRLDAGERSLLAGSDYRPPARAAISDLIGVHGAPIDVSSLTGRIAFSSSTDDVYVVNADGSGLRPVTPSGDLDFDPTWSLLNVIRPDGTGLTRIPVEGIPAEPEMPDWSGA